MTGQALRVRFEDHDLIVVDKPAGVHTAPLRADETGTLIDMVVRSYPEVAALPGIKPVEPGLVHRLDKGTSGLVVIARTAQAFDALRRQFASGGARKHYVAACAFADSVEGGGTGPAAEIGRPLRIESRFAPYGPGRRKVRPVLAGEKSRRLLESASAETYVTEARVTARAAPDGERGGERALLAASLAKGFRHQVRAHLAFLGFLILGDPLYGAAVPAGFPDRMYLHAVRIELQHPATGLPLVVEAPLPPEFDALVAT